MDETTVTTPNELEIHVERVFDAPRAHVFSVWTDPQLTLNGGAGERPSRRWTSVPAVRTASNTPTAPSRASSARSTHPSGSCRPTHYSSGSWRHDEHDRGGTR
jgi:hypothetical protein